MDQKRISEVFYRAASGAEPVRDWLLEMSGADQRIIGYDIATAEFGWPTGMPTCKAMGGVSSRSAPTCPATGSAGCSSACLGAGWSCSMV